MSIIPDPGPQPEVEPTEEALTLPSGTYTVAENTVVYANTLNTLYFIDDDGVTLVNDGTIWLERDSNQYQVLFDGPGEDLTIINNGLIYLYGFGQAQLDAGATYTRTTYINTGSMFAISDVGQASVISSGEAAYVENSGIIAAQTLGTNPIQQVSGNAIAIEARSGRGRNQIINHESGQILAEAPNTATALLVFGVDAAPGTPIVNNAGLIEANSTTDQGISFGIYVPNFSGTVATIVNSGTIRADFAIFTIGAIGVIDDAMEHVFNHEGGTIEGAVVLNYGDDLFQNDGTVTGPVQMGDDNDHFFGTGVVNGYVDMGWGNDTFEGSSSVNLAYGGNDDDAMSGGEAGDLLLGGFGNDNLQGDTGNDGLFGEWGDDTIVTEGGDYVEGGADQDRVVLGDYTFEQANGGSGFDVLAMATGARNFGLAEMVAGGRISGFEAIELQGDQQLAVDATSIGNLVGAAQTLWVDATSTDTVHLEGEWTRGDDVTFEEVLYQTWTQGTHIVRVTEVTEVIPDSAPAFAGFDSIASGLAALRPSVDIGADYSDPVTRGTGIELDFVGLGSRGSYTVHRDAIFLSTEPGTVLYSYDTGTFTNNGEIYAFGATGEAQGPSLFNADDFINNGLIVVESAGDSFFFNSFVTTFGAVADFTTTNTGEIYSYSQYGHATGVADAGRTINSGIVSAIADSGHAIGLEAATGFNDDLPANSESRVFENTGLIYAEGSESFLVLSDSEVPLDDPRNLAAAIGVRGSGSFSNDGSIIAALSGNAASDAFTIGIFTFNRSGGSETGVINNGTISGTYSVVFDQGSIATNYIENNGLLIGDVAFYEGDDIYDNSGGETRGVVYGFGGNDEFIGGSFADIFVGGSGDDILDGGGNVDTAIVSGNRSAYTVMQTSFGVFEVTGSDGADILTNVEFLQFGDETIRLIRGAGVSVNFETADPSVYQSSMADIRDFDGNDLGGNGGWLRIGSADVNGDGDIDQILVNQSIGRFATVGTASDGLVYFGDHGWAGETRVAGTYIDPLVASGDVVAGSDSDSQRRFQNDLEIENINRVLGADDYDGDGLQEVYFALTDGTAYLHAYMHADGNIQYANYQSQQEVIDFLTANGFGEETYADWFPAGQETRDSDDPEEKSEMPVNYSASGPGSWDSGYAEPDAVPATQQQFIEVFA